MDAVCHFQSYTNMYLIIMFGELDVDHQQMILLRTKLTILSKCIHHFASYVTSLVKL